MRPLINKEEIDKNKKLSEEATKFWEEAKYKKNLEKYDDKEVFHLTAKEAEKCRFEMTNMTDRLAECTVHTKNFSHGVRLHPPHLWKLEGGLVYFNHNGKWVRWVANVDVNKQRLEKVDEDIDT